MEKEELLARIQELEAAGHTTHAAWQDQPSMADEEERRRSETHLALTSSMASLVQACPVVYHTSHCHLQPVHQQNGVKGFITPNVMLGRAATCRQHTRGMLSNAAVEGL